jgi:hypothetical protein
VTPEADPVPRKKISRQRDSQNTTSGAKDTGSRPADDADAAKRAAAARKKAARQKEDLKQADLDRVVKRAEERWGITTTKKQELPPSPILTPPTIKPPDAAPSPPQEPKKFEDKINYLGCCFWMGVAASIASAIEQLVRGTTPFSWDNCLGIGFGTAIVLGPCVIMPVYVFIRALFDKS